MPRSLALYLSLATLSGTVAFAQSGPADPSYTQSEPAPVERSYAPANSNGAMNFAPDSNGSGYGAPQQPREQQDAIRSEEPVKGVLIRSTGNADIQTISTAGKLAEFRITSGIVNVSVHHPESHDRILVDLPGGQVSLLKDGLYTFNPVTNTVRVFRGEAQAFSGNGKSITVKEDHFTVLNGDPHAYEGGAATARTDVLPGVYGGGGGEQGYARPYGYGAYGDGYGGYPYGAPYYAYGYPGFYGGYPYGYGLGLGFGYYGGFGRGYYGGGYGGFRGRR